MHFLKMSGLNACRNIDGSTSENGGIFCFVLFYFLSNIPSDYVIRTKKINISQNVT